MSDIASLIEHMMVDCDLGEEHKPIIYAGPRCPIYAFPKNNGRGLFLDVVDRNSLAFRAQEPEANFSQKGAVSNPTGIMDLLIWYAHGRDWTEENLALGTRTAALEPPNPERMVLT